MNLSFLVGKPVYSSSKQKGVCRGVALSLKSRAVKYLVCQKNDPALNGAEFFLPVSAVQAVDESGIYVQKLRAAVPKNVYRFFCGKPVYTEEGQYVGIVTDLSLEHFYAVAVHTDRGIFSALCLSAIGDAVLLKKSPCFPLGRSLPERFFQSLSPDPIVTKTTLKKAIEKGFLIRLTSSMLPSGKKKSLI